MILLKGLNLTSKYCKQVKEVLSETFSLRSLQALKKSVPLAVGIVILLQLKLFPIFVFAFIKSKYQIVITDILVKAIQEKKYQSNHRVNKNSAALNEQKDDEDLLIWANLDLPFLNAMTKDSNLKQLNILGSICEALFQSFPQAII
jgi:hypothetical protein